MKQITTQLFLATLLIIPFIACQTGQKKDQQEKPKEDSIATATVDVQERLQMYEKVQLTTDVSKLTDAEKKVIPLLIEASKIMDELFWYEAYGKGDSLVLALKTNAAKEFVKINYGPWDRLNGNEPFVEGVGEKPLGANFYPADMTKEEFEKFDDPDKRSLYALIERDESGQLQAIWYHDKFDKQVKLAANLLKQAADLAETEDLKRYLNLRAKALLTDDYNQSDIAWLEMEENGIDVIIGPIETYEDKLFGYKAAHEAYVLVKDKAWSNRLAHYVQFLPKLQKGLPVDEKYKSEKPGTRSQLNAYDVVYYAGDCNAGSKTIAVNLPNDEEIQISHGTRRSQLKNAMRAKFDKILIPISEELIADDQRKHISFEAFFANTMFHEVAHGLGIKNTITGKGTVREALKDQASALEEGKADILGLYMITQLHGQGEIKEGELMDYYVTFLASIFRSVRFGASSAHGQANMLRFNYFKEREAFTKDKNNGKYSVNFDKMKEAMNALSAKILQLQGEGDYEGTKQLMEEKGKIGPELQKDLEMLQEKGIPVDITFQQGVEVLGLKPM